MFTLEQRIVIYVEEKQLKKLEGYIEGILGKDNIEPNETPINIALLSTMEHHKCIIKL